MRRRTERLVDITLLAVFVVVIACGLVSVSAQLLTVLNAQAAKTDRQLLTEALATITGIRDRMPADPTIPVLTCAPASQSVVASASASMQAAGGTGAYAWSAVGGTPVAGDAAAFSTSYGTAGAKTVSVASGAQTATCQVAVTSGTIPPVTGTLLMSSSWETALGCNSAALRDSGSWEDYGGSGACDGAVHDADVVADVFRVGKQSLRITQKPPPAGSSGIWNGTDFREQKKFGNRTEVTVIGWVYYAPGYHWASADHKIFILTDNTVSSQNVYVNYRGGSDPQHARLCLYSNPVDAMFCAANPQVTTGIWYRIRVHVVAGTHGKMEAWLTPDGQPEVPMAMAWDAGTRANINDLNVGSIGAIKIDSTYNSGASITVPIYQYYDSVSVFAGLAP